MENKKRLIDANALIEWIDMGHFRNPLETCFSERDVVDMLESRPTVDAVEVVRCKDCKHKGWIQEPCHGKSVDFCHVWDSCVNNPDKCFCSYGERRTDG